MFKTHLRFLFLVLLFLLIACGTPTNGVEVVAGADAGPLNLTLSIDANGKVSVSGGFVPKVHVGLGPIELSLGIQKTIELTAAKPDYLFVVWKDSHGEVQRDEYEIGKKFKVTFTPQEHVQEIEGQNDSVIVVVESESLTQGTFANSPNSVEDFVQYSDDISLQAVFIPNAAWAVNNASIHRDNVNGIPTLRLEYVIRGNTPSDNYVVLDRCLNPLQNWQGAQGIKIWLKNDDKPKQVFFQFGEGYRCSGGQFPFEVWRTFMNLDAGQMGEQQVAFSNFEQETSWAATINNRIDLDKIGYIAIGIRGPAIGQGSIQFGPIGLVH